MSKRLILFLALAFMVGIASVALAEVQNVKVGGDIDIKGIARNSLSLQDPTTTTGHTPVAYGESISAIISTVRVKLDADLTDNVSATVRLLNEREWGEEGAATTDVDLDLAYIALKEFLYSPLTLTLGRQNLRFGSGLIVGDPDTNGIAAGHAAGTPVGLVTSLDDLSSRKSFDAMRATLDYDPLIVDLVYSKIDESGGGENPGVAAYDDIDLYGINAGYAVNSDLNTEVYLWQRSRDANSVLGLRKAENLRTAGARGIYTGLENLVLGLETAMQFGDHVVNQTLYPDEVANTGDNRKVRAYALQASANYAMPDVTYTPVLGASYTYLSGENYLSNSSTYRGWNSMFEDQAGGTLFNKILAFSNVQLFNVSTSLKPMDDVTLALNYYYLRLNQAYTSAQPTAGVILSGVAGDPTFHMKSGEKALGSEIDLGITYDYTEDVQFGLNTGAFIPGSAFTGDNDKTATQVIGSMKVTF
ncbi:MAG: alginate export family protein [Candidatus Omnitrophica bacterium]|nr:alginate export family protein [Candidatus Omnitrophota bacterium]MCG2706249.1 alginate export family protein [Candidatus Omnitrophota bacterium]